MRRFRFAPSCNAPLHMGSLRTALANYLWARKVGAELVVFLEHCTGPLCRWADATQYGDVLGMLLRLDLVPDLVWIDQPSRDGHMPYRDLDTRWPVAPEHRESLYPCTCGVRSFRYAADPCAHTTPRYVPDHAPLRSRVGEHGIFAYRHGGGEFWTAAGAYAVIGHEYGITDAVRGNDLVSVASEERALMLALGLHPPTTHTIGCVTHDGAKLSKSTGDIDAPASLLLRFDPMRVLRVLVESLLPADLDPLSLAMDDYVAAFRPPPVGDDVRMLDLLYALERGIGFHAARSDPGGSRGRTNRRPDAPAV